MTNVEITKKTNNGKNVENVEIEKMDVFQTVSVAKGIAELVKFVNQNNKLQNVFKTFNKVRKEVNDEATAYYAEQKKKGVKEADMATYDDGTLALGRAGEIVWPDILSLATDLLYEVPETVVEIVANASGIKKDVLGKQDIEVFIDVFDAVVEVNDIQAIVNRTKKLGGTFNKIKPMFSKQAEK